MIDDEQLAAWMSWPKRTKCGALFDADQICERRAGHDGAHDARDALAELTEVRVAVPALVEEVRQLRLALKIAQTDRGFVAEMVETGRCGIPKGPEADELARRIRALTVMGGGLG